MAYDQAPTPGLLIPDLRFSVRFWGFEFFTDGLGFKENIANLIALIQNRSYKSQQLTE